MNDLLMLPFLIFLIAFAFWLGQILGVSIGLFIYQNDYQLSRKIAAFLDRTRSRLTG